MRQKLLVLAGWLLAQPMSFAGEEEARHLSRHLTEIRAVRKEGVGNATASQAWRKLTESAGASDLPKILTAMDGTNVLVENWLGAAVDVIARRALERGEELPASGLESFLLDGGHSRRARRLAFEWLTEVDSGAPDRILPRLLEDPSPSFRREAVARLLLKAQNLEESEGKEKALPLYRQALQAARDPGQVKALAGKLGEPVNLPRHFGYLMRWKVIGPFDNSQEEGFDRVYKPEQKLDVDGEHSGKKGPVRWKDHVTSDDFGQVDLNRVVGREKGVIAYALATFTSNRKCEVELRMASQNAWKLWFDGKLLFARHEYHRGTEFDHFRFPVQMTKGKHQILVKVCQNEQTQDFADVWRYHLRVCDATGTAVLSAGREEAGGGQP